MNTPPTPEQQEQLIEDLRIVVRDLLRVLLVVDHVVTYATPDGKRTVIASNLMSR